MAARRSGFLNWVDNLNRLNEGLTIDTPGLNLSWRVYIINLVNNAKLFCDTSPLTKHHSFFTNVPPFYMQFTWVLTQTTFLRKQWASGILSSISTSKKKKERKQSNSVWACVFTQIPARGTQGIRCRLFTYLVYVTQDNSQLKTLLKIVQGTFSPNPWVEKETNHVFSD